MIVVAIASRREECDGHRTQSRLLLVSEKWVCPQVIYHRADSFRRESALVQRKKLKVPVCSRDHGGGTEATRVSELDFYYLLNGQACPA